MSATGKSAYPIQEQGTRGPPPYNTPDPNAVPPVMTAPLPMPTSFTPAPAPTVAFGPHPASLTCPSCGARITSKMEYETTMKTHGMCMLMCAFGLWCCCFVPYLMDSCKNANHYCPNCNAYLGNYQR